MNTPTLTLITGGSRSGKSRFAREKILPFSRKVFLATAVATDPEMAERIERHKRERDPGIRTVEEPVRLAQVIRREAPSVDVILVDCLTFWLNNLFHYFGRGEACLAPPVSKEIEDFLKVLDEKPTSLILVTNEVNMGVIPNDPLSREFVDRQGWLNQEVARRADEMILMVAGIPQVLKDKRHYEADRVSRSNPVAEIASPATKSMAGSPANLSPLRLGNLGVWAGS